MPRLRPNAFVQVSKEVSVAAEIRFLQALPEDAEELSILESNNMKHPWNKEMILEVLENPRGGAIKAVDNDGIIVGYVNYTYIFEEMEIGNLCVDTAYRRQGIAQKLLEELFTFSSANGVEKVFLEVSSQNEPAHKLYIKCGFEEINVRKNYYGSNDHAIIMCFEKRKL